MDEEFDGLHGVLDDEEIEDSQGELEDSDVEGVPQKPTRQRQGDDLTEDPRVRAMQSSYDRQIAYWQQQAQANQRRLAILEDALRKSGAEGIDAVLLMAEIDQLRAENEAYRQQTEFSQQAENYRQTQIKAARRLGLDPYDPEYQASIQEALDTGDGAVVEDKRAEMLARKKAAKPKQEAGEETRKPGYAVPPSGGVAPQSKKGRLLGDFEKARRELIKSRPGDTDALNDLRQEYVEKGLEWPDVWG